MPVVINGSTGVTFPAGGTGNPAGAVVGTTDTQTLTNKSIIASQIDSGTIATARLGSGAASSSTFLRGDNTWAVATDGVGYNQTWQDVIGSRAVSTSYQNTTGRPIQVSIRGSNGNNVEASVNNSTWVKIGALISASAVSMTNITAVIPNNHYYRVNGGTVNDWSELR